MSSFLFWLLQIYDPFIGFKLNVSVLIQTYSLYIIREAETRQGIVEVIFATDLVGKKVKRLLTLQWSKDIWCFPDGLQNILSW